MFMKLKGIITPRMSQRRGRKRGPYKKTRMRYEELKELADSDEEDVKVVLNKSNGTAEPSVPELRAGSKRAASKVAMKQLQKLSKSILNDKVDEEGETLEILSDADDEFVPDFQATSTKKTYKVSQRKSSDGNERDILVFKSLNSGSTLNLECWTEELSAAQLEMRSRRQREYLEMSDKIESLIKKTGAEIIYEGFSFTAFEIESAPTTCATVPVSILPSTSQQPSIPIATASTLVPTAMITPTPVAIQPAVTAVTKPPPPPSATATATTPFSLVLDARSGQVVGTVTQASSSPVLGSTSLKTRKRGRAATNSPTPTKVAKMSNVSQPPPLVALRDDPNMIVPTKVQAIAPKPTQASSSSCTSPSPSVAVVDLTSEDSITKAPPADSREVAFNKLAGRTFPSLVVMARPHLRVSPTSGSAADRTRLDQKVKAVLTHSVTKFTEWLLQQGIIRAEQSCSVHNSKLKLGMYSELYKFPFSGGYVWISECCPLKFTSVFQGSLFESTPHAPSVILKLIYHWCCQTNVQNVVQWVRVENLYVKGLNTWLRSVCTVALHTHIERLGGPGIKVEIGVISLGTTTQDGQQRQVKVEVLGILECGSKKLRLRAVEPLTETERNYRKRFNKILEPLTAWVHPSSIIVTDLTVDKGTLHALGFLNVQQTNSAPGNQQIMEYLRKIVPRMFQNTLSLLSRQIIQQFLDELVWREWYGTTAAEAFDNLMIHLAEQTKVDTGHSLIQRLNKVSSYPFKNWSIFTYLASHKPLPPMEHQIKRQRRKQNFPKSGSPTFELVKPNRSTTPLDIPEQMVPLEHYYYGTIEAGLKEKPEHFDQILKCLICKQQVSNNIELMLHYFKHAQNISMCSTQCHYCLAVPSANEDIETHIQQQHPNTTKVGSSFVCIICESSFPNVYDLGKHLSKIHGPSELPYQCDSCLYRCSNHKQIIDHFHQVHKHESILQCPYCIKTVSLLYNGRFSTQQLSSFLNHLQKHSKKSVAKKCTKCALSFVLKDDYKEHIKMHISLKKDVDLMPWPINGILAPKCVKDYEIVKVDISNVTIDAPENTKCKECGIDLTTVSHFPGVLSCTNDNCRYITCCKISMDNHESLCNIVSLPIPYMKLPFKMYCVCDYTSNDGNDMAKHLAVCERRSAYPTQEAAKTATVTHSMLDVLGLIRKPEEALVDIEPLVRSSKDEDDEYKMDKDVRDARADEILLIEDNPAKLIELRPDDLEENKTEDVLNGGDDLEETETVDVIRPEKDDMIMEPMEISTDPISNDDELATTITESLDAPPLLDPIATVYVETPPTADADKSIDADISDLADTSVDALAKDADTTVDAETTADDVSNPLSDTTTPLVETMVTESNSLTETADDEESADVDKQKT
ncbi:PREDICTED: uncharacterized protein LOC108561434 isoform X1 [Nicrophorus vespilloides]|uniref:Uncharacterized protein LOC108561434 isoform X1 n=1 Tax=Nicrophorus vespilloides TaxID=110193 RepID=A0ABM1MJV7_NICVS|nr:PREDICTED: uncharacterized protein LOC108561434 isoform X1 [Nicrophorus vespilloides]